MFNFPTDGVLTLVLGKYMCTFLRHYIFKESLIFTVILHIDTICLKLGQYHNLVICRACLMDGIGSVLNCNFM